MKVIVAAPATPPPTLAAYLSGLQKSKSVTFASEPSQAAGKSRP